MKANSTFILLIVSSVSCHSLDKARIDFAPSQPEAELVSPIEIISICKSIQSLIGITNNIASDEQLVGWALKKKNSDRPPVLIEEVFCTFKTSRTGTNYWIIAAVKRMAGRGRTESHIWDSADYGRDFIWLSSSVHKPTESDFCDFMKRSNFGYNECNPDVIPVHVSIYAPYKRVLKAAAKPLTRDEREKRFSGSAKIIRGL